ncbi:class I SAM-dependent methyltransferase [Aeromonas intestinalis]
MSQNIYDNQGFFEGYAQLPRSQQGLAGAPEWPALQAMLPALSGKRVLDLGCGYGWFCRAARELGAGEVTGIDLSTRMLARAAELTRDDRIHYQQGDLARLELSREPFDLVYSSLALHYLPEVNSLFAQIHGALVAGGSFVFSVEHPIFTCPQPQGWLVDEEGRRSWPINGYQREGERVSNWLAEGVIKYHRTLGTYLNALIGAGFEIRHVEDWGPTAGQIAANPALAEEAERPMLLLVAVQKPLRRETVHDLAARP